MAGEPTLHKGVSNEWVIHLQELMRDRGYWHGAIDGSFDDALEQAVQQLQDQTGLMQTGEVNAETWQMLEQLPAHQAPAEAHAHAAAHSGGHSGHDEHATAHHDDHAAAHHEEHASSSDSHPTLRKGISGEWVVYLQQLLQHAGYWHGATDGAFDDTLEQAVQQLQDNCGLMQTGVVDAQTWAALDRLRHQSTADHSAAGHAGGEAVASSGSHPVLRKGVSSEWVHYLQQVMQHVGYWNGPVTGTFDDALEAAVQRLQDANGLMQTGVVDAETWSLLDRLQHHPAAAGTESGSGTAPARRSVAEMTASEKLIEAFNRADINSAVRERVLAALSPEALAAAVITFAGVFVASQVTPVGWAADIALGLTAVFVGTAVLRAGGHLIDFAAAANATTDAQLDAAGHAFAQAVAELEVDALLFLITRAAGGFGGGAPASTPPTGGVVLATRGSQLVVVAADTIPATVAGQLGISAGAGVLAMTGPGRDDPDYWEETYGDRDEGQPRRERISDGNKQELEDSGWLRGRIPGEERRREFMEWLQRRHEQGEAHVHLRPGSREAEAAVREFEAENPP